MNTFNICEDKYHQIAFSNQFGKEPFENESGLRFLSLDYDNTMLFEVIDEKKFLVFRLKYSI